MTRRRRATLLTGLALLLGALAAGDVARREAALREGVGPSVRVLVAARDLPAGTRLAPAHLALRRVPARWAPGGALTDPAEVAGLHVAGDVPAGADVTSSVVRAPAPDPGAAFSLRRGERAVQVVAGAPPGGAGGRARVAIAGAEVLAAEPVEAGAGEAAGPRVAATLRVTVRQALALATAEAYARDLRLLPRPVVHTSSAP